MHTKEPRTHHGSSYEIAGESTGMNLLHLKTHTLTNDREKKDMRERAKTMVMMGESHEALGW